MWNKSPQHHLFYFAYFIIYLFCLLFIFRATHISNLMDFYDEEDFEVSTLIEIFSRISLHFISTASTVFKLEEYLNVAFKYFIYFYMKIHKVRNFETIEFHKRQNTRSSGCEVSSMRNFSSFNLKIHEMNFKIYLICLLFKAGLNRVSCFFVSMKFVTLGFSNSFYYHSIVLKKFDFYRDAFVVRAKTETKITSQMFSFNLNFFLFLSYRTR